ncbi:MAG: hypothetical protein R2697_04165 [Ilumatobacteraceae bacterium]
MSLEAELSARGESDVADRLMQVEQLRERARWPGRRPRRARGRSSAMKGSLLDAGVVANLEGDAARFRSELDEVETALGQVQPETEQLEADEIAPGKNARRLRRPCSMTRRASAKAASAAAEVRGELRSIRNGVERSEERASPSDDREELTGRIEQLEADTERLRADRAQAESVETPLVDQIAAAEQERAEADEAVERLSTTDRADANEAASRASARVEALQLKLRRGARSPAPNDRRRRWCARHPARPGRDRPGMAGGRRGIAR